MAEIQVRLSQLRETAAVLAQSSQRMRQSAQAVQDVIHELHLLGMPDSPASLMARPDRGHEFADMLWSLACSLGQAADDVERAAKIRLPHFDLSLLPHKPDKPVVINAQQRTLSAASGERLPYVSVFNMGLFEGLQARKNALAQAQERLAALQTEREQEDSSFRALRNMMRSYEPMGAIDSSSELKGYRSQIAALDAEISTVSAEVDSLEAEVQQLDQRLTRVMPGNGADLTEIQALEGAESAPWLVDNTYDCVRHVVEKMPVPGEVARDAKRWVEEAARYTQYGITSGDVPLAGSVIVMQPEHAYADDAFGHVLYVERVESGTVWVTDNVHPDTPVRLNDLTSDTSPDDITYLYFPWHTRA